MFQAKYQNSTSSPVWKSFKIAGIVKSCIMPHCSTVDKNNFKRLASVVIKLKLENCLNVLKIVSKEPVDRLLLIKD